MHICVRFVQPCLNKSVNPCNPCNPCNPTEMHYIPALQLKLNGIDTALRGNLASLCKVATEIVFCCIGRIRSEFLNDIHLMIALLANLIVT